MGRSLERHGGSGRVVPISGAIHPRSPDAHGPGRWPPLLTPAACTALILWGLVLLPDINAFWGNTDTAWVVYLSMEQVRNALFCVAAFTLPRSHSTTVMLVASAGWYVGQGIDEAVYGNTFYDGLWEYGAIALISLDVWYYLWLRDREEHTGPVAEAPLDAR